MKETKKPFTPSTIDRTTAMPKNTFVRRTKPTKPGETGTPYALNNGLGHYSIVRQKMMESGKVVLELPYDWNAYQALQPLLMKDIRSNTWGADDDGIWYPIAPDIARVAFPDLQDIELPTLKPTRRGTQAQRYARLTSLPEGIQVRRDNNIRYYWYNQITDTSRRRLWRLMDTCLQLASNPNIHIWRAANGEQKGR